MQALLSGAYVGLIIFVLGEGVKGPVNNFHLLKNMFFLYFPLLVLQGIDHYWKYVIIFFPGGLSKWKLGLWFLVGLVPRGSKDLIISRIESVSDESV